MQGGMEGGGHMGGGRQTHYDDLVKKGRKTRWRYKCTRFTLLLLIILFIVLGTTTWRDPRHGGGNHSDKNGDDEGNGDGGNNGKDGDDDATPPQPWVPSNDTWWTSPRLDKCHFEYQTSNHYFEFASPRSFSFFELMEDDRDLVREVEGLIKLTTAPAAQQAAIVVEIWFSTTSQYEVTEINVQHSDESLSLKAPTLKATGLGKNERPCLVAHVTLFVKSDVTLSDLEVATRHLNLRVDSGLFDQNKSLKIVNSTEFTAVAGDVSIAHWSSRNTVIDVISGSVKGEFALQDILSIQTRSGDIDVDIKPKPVDKTAPAAAEFTAMSISGKIDARFPVSGTSEDIPEREYRTRTETKSGDISGSYILGRVSSFKSISGVIAADILPYDAATAVSGLRTEVASGHTKINVLSPFRNKGRPMKHLTSSHQSISAGLTLTYPQEWEGRIEGRSLSGDMKVSGKDVQVIGRIERPGSKRLSAKKGSGASEMSFSTISGNVEVLVGDL